ncbi:MAG: tRNA pseudouridine(38-40) synthase TruA [Aeromicrobium sp.]
MRYRLDLSYDGTHFSGWGVQPELRTVQGELENAIQLILRLDEPSRLTVAGRTDAGVHARGQVAHVDLDGEIDPPRLLWRLRNLLDPDIQMRDLRVAADGFDARFSALQRRYTYRICDVPEGPDPLQRAHIYHHGKRLDTTAMNYAEQHLLGEHDFASFCKPREGATTIRTLRNISSVRREDGIIETSVVADAFCHSMVRALMGTIIVIGQHKYEPVWAGKILAAATRQPHIEVMPAHGLTLEQVTYPPEHLVADRAVESRRRRARS